MQGAAGMVAQPEGYLKRLYDIVRKHEILFMADEVATGFGRTGKMFACEMEGIEPDIMCMGKGITGGTLPLAATMVNDRVYNAFLGEFDEFKTFFHGHTYTGNPLACAAALANLDLFAENRVLDNLALSMERLEKGLSEIADLKHVVEVRRQGMMVGIELSLDKQADNPYPASDRMGHKVIMAARKHGVIIRPLGDTVILMPPLSSTPEELDLLLDATQKAIIEVTETA
jgi:adenosylmethionine-8-amino-7-oxononanoate aminotransferase